jgi:hypothetical protein
MPRLTVEGDSLAGCVQARDESLQRPRCPREQVRQTLLLLLDTALPRPPLTYVSSLLALDLPVPATVSISVSPGSHMPQHGLPGLILAGSKQMSP